MEQSQEWIGERLERWRTRRDPEALGELLKWQRVRAYATAQRVLDNQADAEDAVQQAFLKLLSRTEGFGSALDFKAAVYRAVIQCAFDMARARRSRGSREKAMVNTIPVPTARQGVEDAETLRLVQEELGQMTDEERAVVTLCCQEGLNLTEAAAALEAPRETVRDRLARSLTTLRARLKRRGLALSLLFLAGALHKGQAYDASPKLCAALDTQLPGAACQQITSADTVSVHAPDLLAQAGLAPASVSLPLAAAAMLVLLIAAGTAWRFSVAGSPAPAEDPAAKLQVLPAVVESAPRPTSAPAVVTSKAAPTNQVQEKKAGEAPQTALTVQLPPHIRKAMEDGLKGFVPTKVDEERRGGKLIYDIEGKVGEKRFDMEVTADGKVLKIEEAEDDEDDAPKAAPPPQAPEESF